MHTHTPIPKPTRRGLLVLAFAALLTACGGNKPIEDDADTLVGPTAADEPLPDLADPAPGAAAAEALAAQPGRRAAPDRSALNAASTVAAPTETPTR